MGKRPVWLVIACFTATMILAPASARESTRISGIGFFDEENACNSEKIGADFALVLSGDLQGCLYVFVETADFAPSGTYVETGTEFFLGTDGTFETEYRFEAKYEDPVNLLGEIFGRCQHVIVDGSGTGAFEGVTGRLDFKDDIETKSFPYRGSLQFPE